MGFLCSHPDPPVCREGSRLRMAKEVCLVKTVFWKKTVFVRCCRLISPEVIRVWFWVLHRFSTLGENVSGSLWFVVLVCSF